MPIDYYDRKYHRFFVEGDKSEGKSLLKKAEKEADNLHYKGWREMEFEELAKLKTLME